MISRKRLSAHSGCSLRRRSDAYLDQFFCIFWVVYGLLAFRSLGWGLVEFCSMYMMHSKVTFAVTGFTGNYANGNAGTEPKEVSFCCQEL